MADSCITIWLAREDRERIDALTRELAKLSAQLHEAMLSCVADEVVERALHWRDRVQPDGDCDVAAVVQRFNDWQASRRAVVSDEPR